jgi:hypothetical protein
MTVSKKSPSARVIVTRARKRIEALQEDLNALVETTDYEKLLKAHEENMQRTIVLESELRTATTSIRAAQTEINRFPYYRDQRLSWEDQTKQLLALMQKISSALTPAPNMLRLAVPTKQLPPKRG